MRSVTVASCIPGVQIDKALAAIVIEKMGTVLAAAQESLGPS
jgi:hypothetical protein